MTTRTLVLLRHAKSDWSGSEPDHDRPLAARGRRQAPEAGEWLNGALAHLDLAVVSTALRARQTWELVAAELDDPPPIRVDENVYAASAHELLDVVRSLREEEAVVLVGHNPGLEWLVEGLTGTWVPMKTAALAVIETRGSWEETGPDTARLVAHGRPPG